MRDLPEYQSLVQQYLVEAYTDLERQMQEAGRKPAPGAHPTWAEDENGDLRLSVLTVPADDSGRSPI